MVTQSYACVETFADEDSVLDAATTLWVVLQSADELPATPESRARLARARTQFRELLSATGITEDEIRVHALRRRQQRRRGPLPPSGPPRGQLRLLSGES